MSKLEKIIAAVAWTWREPVRRHDIVDLPPAMMKHLIKNSIPALPRLGWIQSEPLGNGTRFVVFGGTDGLYYGACDEKTGDPLFPGPFVVEGGDFPDEATVERVGIAIFRAWRLGLLDGAATDGSP